MTTTEPNHQPGPYTRAAHQYRAAGWEGVIPIAHRKKWPPPNGWTGADGAWPSPADIQAWCDNPSPREGGGNIALRMPPNVIGLDVDTYDGKPGATTLEAATQRWGDLPATWITTARFWEGLYSPGIRLYQVPEGLWWPGELGPGVEIIQHRHRYAMVWPSEHPNGGTYRWEHPLNNHPIETPPHLDRLPHLPEAWIAGLTRGQAATTTQRAGLTDGEAWDWLTQLTGQPCPTMAAYLERVTAGITHPGHGSRHDMALHATRRLTQLGADGHPGALHAITALHATWVATVEAEPGRDTDPQEWTRMVHGAIDQAAATGPPATVDPCTDPFAALIAKDTPWTPSTPTTSATNAPAPTADAAPTNMATTTPTPTTTDPAVFHSDTNPSQQPPAPTTAPPPLTPAQVLLNQEIERERARRDARRHLDDEALAATADGSISLLTDGATFILDAPPNIPAVWGHGQDIAWAEGESLMIVGPPGVGKTTLAGQIIRARLGITTNPTLDLPITPTTSRVLYLAMDRPAQAARAMRRLYTEQHRQQLADRLVIWKGPPPTDVAKNPDTFIRLAHQAGADTIVIDSVKDAAIGLSEDDVAAGYNRARQTALAAGIQLLELHHLVKRGAGGGKPTTLADVYGSAWLTAGAGSVLLLWGAAGDPVVELIHLKQPAEPIGPYKVIHDHDQGETSIFHSTDLLALTRSRGQAGLTAKHAAEELYETDKPTASEVEKARRKLDHLATTGHLERRDGQRGNFSGGPQAATWHARKVSTEVFTDLIPSEPPHGTHEKSRSTPETPETLASSNHGTTHGNHGPGVITPTPPFKGGWAVPNDHETTKTRSPEPRRETQWTHDTTTNTDQLLDRATGEILATRKTNTPKRTP